MTRLELTASDTKPLICTYKAGGVPVIIDGYAFTLKIGYPEPLQVAAEIIDVAAGKYQFPFGSEDLVAGIFSAEILITNPAGEEETTDKFQVHIVARTA